MIWLDVTKSGSARQRSGLTRVTRRLAEELGAAATATGSPVEAAARRFARDDVYLTAEVFAPDERPGFAELLAARPCRLAAIYHDSIPLRYPHISWPQAVARHPAYLAMLARFDLIWAVSAASRDELLGFWKWQGRAAVPRVEVLPLGADLSRSGGRGSGVPAAFSPSKRRSAAANQCSDLGVCSSGGDAASTPILLCVGIIEPRKNQSFLLEVADRLWGEGVPFELRIAGRVNPHFGKPILTEIQTMQGKRPSLCYDGPVSDSALSALYTRATACVFPTIAEGCGLPLLEALWHGTPCISSDLPSLVENARGGGCLVLPVGNVEAWTAALRQLLTEPAYRQTLAGAAAKRQSSLPTWAQTAQLLLRRMAPAAPI